MHLALTPEQTAQLDPLWHEALATGSGNALAGQLRRHTFPHPDAGALYLEVALIHRKTAEAIRKAHLTHPPAP